MSSYLQIEQALPERSPSFEKSDEAIVPRKSAKTLVTLVESMEGRAETAGKLAVANAYSTQSETIRAHAV